MDNFKNRLNTAIAAKGITAAELSKISGVNEGAISQYRKGAYKATQRNLEKLSIALGVPIPWLMGGDVGAQHFDLFQTSPFPAPRITEDVVTFPVIGEVAAGYEHIAAEDWSGDTIDIPAQYLRGHDVSEFFVLTVHGDSMYPLFVPEDKVLVLRQSTIGQSGDIGVVRYNGDAATLKKVEFDAAGGWMRFVPINPNYPPRTIRGADLDACSVLGVPRLVLRELGE